MSSGWTQPDRRLRRAGRVAGRRPDEAVAPPERVGQPGRPEVNVAEADVSASRPGRRRGRRGGALAGRRSSRARRARRGRGRPSTGRAASSSTMIDVQRATAGMPARFAPAARPGSGCRTGPDARAAARPPEPRLLDLPAVGVVVQDVAAVGRGEDVGRRPRADLGEEPHALRARSSVARRLRARSSRRLGRCLRRGRSARRSHAVDLGRRRAGCGADDPGAAGPRRPGGVDAV